MINTETKKLGFINLNQGFRKGQKVNYLDSMTEVMKVGFVIKKIKNQYLIGETMDHNEYYLDTAFDTVRGRMSLIS